VRSASRGVISLIGDATLITTEPVRTRAITAEATPKTPQPISTVAIAHP
jgi:hypothetical protein